MNRGQGAVTAEQVIRLLAWSILLGCVFILVYAFQARDRSQFAAVLGVTLLLAGAAVVLGALLGFLFGIPRSLQQSSLESSESARTVSTAERDTNRAAFRANTSLEQISDWLTKILVGVGLTQLSRVPAAIESFSGYVGGALGGLSGANLFAGAAALYFSVCGFLTSYLWTRLNLGKAFTQAEILEIERKVADWQRQVEANQEALQMVLLQLDSSQSAIPEDDIKKAIKVTDNLYASHIYDLARRARLESRLRDKKQLERVAPVFRALILRSPDTYPQNYGQLGFVLFEKEPQDLVGCEKNLSQAIRMRGPWLERGHWAYELVRALCRIQMDERYKRRERADASTRQAIIDDLRVVPYWPPDSLEKQTRKTIDDWLELNGLSYSELG